MQNSTVDLIMGLVQLVPLASMPEISQEAMEVGISFSSACYCSLCFLALGVASQSSDPPLQYLKLSHKALLETFCHRVCLLSASTGPARLAPT